MTEIREIKSIEDYNHLLENDNVVLKCSASWCFPCKVLGSTIKSLNNDIIKNVVFGEIDIEEDFADTIVNEYNIRGVPVLLFFKNGELINRSVGNIPGPKIIEIINETYN